MTIPLAMPLTVPLLVAGLSSSCLAPTPPVDQWKITSGSTVRDLIENQSRDTVIVVVHDPAECLTCDGELNEWLELARLGDLSVILLLSRESTPLESTRLALTKIRPDGVLQRPYSKTTPSVYKFIDLEMVDSALGPEDQRAFRLTVEREIQ